MFSWPDTLARVIKWWELLGHYQERMPDRNIHPLPGERRGQMQGAADVGGHHDIGPGRGAGLGVGQGLRPRRFTQKVVSGGPAAGVVTRQFHYARPRDTRKQLVDEARAPEGVAQRAGVVHGDGLRERRERQAIDLGPFHQIAMDIVDLREPTFRLPAVAVKFGGAARGYGYERRGAAREGLAIALPLAKADIGEPGVGGERPATTLGAGHMNTHTEGMQDALGGIQDWAVEVGCASPE